MKTVNFDEYEKIREIGLTTFSEKHRSIMAELVAHGIPATYAVLTETAAEAIIDAVAAMIAENNHSLLSAPVDGCSRQ